ncbi:MAG: restriction endonuclease subunit S [Candidatus Pacebacteria bacterium]|nr:restriction endonuclease subunit S [Candidatus Paceibacterota bacterium]
MTETKSTKENIPEGWVETTLDKITESIFSGGTPNTKEDKYWGGEYSWLSSGETGKKNIYKTIKKITKEGAENSSTRLARKGSVVMATAGQGNTRGQVSFLHIDTYINQSIICITGKENKLDNRWLFYNLSNRYSELRALSESNSVRGSITTSMLKSHFSILLPPLPEQRAIADVLSSFDDKIELLREQNKTLEKTAQTIFKEWFGKYSADRPNELPEGWRVGKLNEIIENIKDTLTPGNDLIGRKYIPIDEIPMKRIGLDSYKPIEDAKSSLIGFEPGDILFGAMRSYFHRVNFSTIKGVTRTTTMVLRPKKRKFFLLPCF